MQRLLNIEWDAVSGVLAAVTAVVLHFLHVIETRRAVDAHARA